jgi:hypothetical protein
LNLRWDLEQGGWTAVDGPQWLGAGGATRGRILAAIQEHGSARAADLGPELDLQVNTVTQTLRRMVADGQVADLGNGMYGPVSDLSEVSEGAVEASSVPVAQASDERVTPPAKPAFPLRIVPTATKDDA